MKRQGSKQAPSFDAGDALDVGFRIKLPRSALERHAANRAVNRPFLAPGPIMLAADRPGDARIAVGVPSIDLVAIVHAHREVGMFHPATGSIPDFLAQYMRK